MNKVNLQEKLKLIEAYRTPVIVGELNNQYVKLVKVKGEFTMHHHDNEDEFFMVHKGLLTIQFSDKTVEPGKGEFLVVPRGVDHKPIADSEVHLLLFEPEATLNTGNVRNELTVDSPEYK